MKRKYNKIHFSRHWKCCYAYILKFLCVQSVTSVFNCSYNMFRQSFLVLLFYLRFYQIGKKLQQPFRNQRHKFTRYIYKMSTLRPTFLIMSIYIYLFIQFDVGFSKYLIQFCNFKRYSYIYLRERYIIQILEVSQSFVQHVHNFCVILQSIFIIHSFLL